MKLLDLTYPTPSLNLAADEALLDWAEADKTLEVLRFWESPVNFVVLGYGNSFKKEVKVAECARLSIPLLRRCSGGGTVLQGPGCLNYSLILQISRAPELESITGANCLIMRKQREAVQKLLPEQVEIRGTTDLCVGDLKFSGNAQRRKRNALLFHGSFLIDMEVGLIEAALAMPARQPDYRAQRPHREFLRHLPVERAALKQVIASVWRAWPALDAIPEAFLSPLEKRYADLAWNLKF